MSLKTKLFNHIKNIPGWKTSRKIIVFSVDDYGNVRLDSLKSRNEMESKGNKFKTAFDCFDSLENREDLEGLYSVLTSVKDKNGKHAIFTPFSLPCNIDFEKMEENNYHEFENEILPQTFLKCSNRSPKKYEGTWELWLEGISKGIMVPQFHGREHLNLKIFNEQLKTRNPSLLNALKNRSFTAIDDNFYDTISYTAAFEFDKFQENDAFKEIIPDGLNAFEKVFGFKAKHFNSPGGREHTIIHDILKENGIKYLDSPFIKKEHQGNGEFKTKINYTGKQNHIGMTMQVRNVVFEPTLSNINWVDFSLNQIEVAFKWNRPAIISSHRVNFCGNINEKNRKKGLADLQSLLFKIIAKWPDVEFMSSEQLGNIIIGEK